MGGDGMGSVGMVGVGAAWAVAHAPTRRLQPQPTRRRVVPTATTRRGSLAGWASVVSASGWAAAVPAAGAGAQQVQQQQGITAKEVEAEDSPMIQAMLARSAEKKEEREKERLQAYYKKNFKEYFQFTAGTCEKGSKATPECARVLQWLEDNK